MDLPENLSVSSIAVDPNDSKIFYVGTGESYVQGDVNGNGLWKSSDGGSTWGKVFGGITGDAVINNTSGTALVPGIAHINDIAIRNNNGNSELYIAVADASYSSTNPTTTIIGSDSFGIYKSTDGNNFSRLNLPKTPRGNNYEPNNIKISIDNSIFVSTISSDTSRDGGGTILKSTDGTNFDVINTIPNGDRTEITLSSSNANTAYVLAEIRSSRTPVKIYKTTNGFVNLNETALPNAADPDIAANDFTRGQAFYDLLIKVDPNNDNVLYAGGIDLFKSIDGGGTWNQISEWVGRFNIQYVHADHHGIAFASSLKMVFSNDGGVYYSENAGIDINSRNNNYNTLQFYTLGVAPTTSLPGDNFLAGAQDNGTLIFENAGSGITGSRETTGGDGASSFFDQDGNDTYYITNTTFNSFISFFSTVGLRNPTLLINDENVNNGDFINQQDLDSNLDILYSNYSSNNSSNNLYKIRKYSGFKTGTVSKSDLLNIIMMDSEPSSLKVSPYTTSATNLFAGLKNGKLLKIQNANTSSPTWTDITGSEFVGSISDIEFGATENDIFVTFHNYGVRNIWYTNDGGTTWFDKEGNFPDIPVKSILQNPLNREEVIIGTDLGVWKTSNFSATSPSWTRSDNGMSNVPVLDLDLRDDNVVFAATYGRGVFSGAFTAATASVDEVLKGDKIFTVYPTVSNGEFTVFAKRENGATNINVFNLSGSQVLTKKVDFNDDEKQIISTNLSSGVYLVQVINSENKISTRKIVIK